MGRFMLTYDPEQKRYRGWWFSSTGPTGEYADEWDEDSQTIFLSLNIPRRVKTPAAIFSATVSSWCARIVAGE